MATMHPLFFSLLSVAFFDLGSLGYRPIAERDPATLRDRIVAIAVQEIGVQEATGHNDGVRVETYLAYTGLGKGYAWCAAFVSWSYGQAGRPAPCNAWSPALFPRKHRYTAQAVQAGHVRQADLFGIYNARLRRIDHVGIVRKMEDHWVLTVEGNSADRVLSKRRPRATVYAFSNWLD